MEVCKMFQTPKSVVKYMIEMMEKHHDNYPISVLEPTPGHGNIVEALWESENVISVYAPKDYFLDRDDILSKKFDCVIMNPPFSKKSCILDNAPEFWKEAKGMTAGYNFIYDALEVSDHVIALMPWFTIADSDVRMRKFLDFGLISVTLLPRKTFDYARIQTCILHLKKGFNGNTEFKYLRKI